MSDIQGLYRHFKHRVASLIRFTDDEMNGKAPSSINASSSSIISLLSNMLAIYKGEGDDPSSSSFSKRENILIYWPKIQSESATKTCIIDSEFERTNVRNEFHIVYRDVLSSNIQEYEQNHGEGGGEDRILLKFKPCLCYNHKSDIPFDWNEFITYDLVHVLYRYYIRLQSTSSSSSFSPYSSPLSSPLSPPSSSNDNHVTDTVNRVLDEYFSNSHRMRKEESESHHHLQSYYVKKTTTAATSAIVTTKSINVKPMGLSQYIKEDKRRFDNNQVFNNVVFESNAFDIYKEYESDMMILFSNNRLCSHYDRYYSNKHIPSHPVTCHLDNISIKLHLYDGIITLHAVDESTHHPYYVLLSTAALQTTNLNVNLLNIYMPFQSSELDLSTVCQNTNIPLDEIFGNNLCIIECREDLQFSFKTVKKKEPFMMAIITPGKCTINSTSCHYELWTNATSGNVMPLFHLINTKTSYLSTKKVLTDTTAAIVPKKRRLSNDTTTLPIPSHSLVKKTKKYDNDDDEDNGNNIDISGSGGEGEDGHVKQSPISLMNEIMDVYGLKEMIDTFKVDEYGSIFHLFEKEKKVSMIQSIKEDHDGLPVFYLNDRLLHLHITENEGGHLITPTNEEMMAISNGIVPLYKRQTLYYNSKPLTHIEINEEDGSISFEPVYYQNSCHRQSLIAY